MIRGLKRFSLLLALIYWVGANIAFAQTITQGYDADTTLQRGMIVALMTGDSSKVEAINNSRAEEIHGVVVTSNDATISISEENQKVYVATSGKFEVLVSDFNGDIESGDYISVSSVSGIGMKTDENQVTVVGKSLQSFSGENDERFISKTTVKDANGKDTEISLGRVAVDISIGKNPLAKDIDAPFILQKIGESVSGGPVSGPQLYFALAVLLVAIGISGGIIYSSVRSGLISIGRNPLSKNLIGRSMIQMILVAFVIFFSALFGVYLILKI